MAVIGGDHVFEADGTFDGTVGGDVIVRAGVTATVRGAVGGDVIVETGATVRLTAAVGGDVVNRGGTVEMGGPDR